MKMDYDKEGSSSGDGGRFFFFRMGVWRGRKGGWERVWGSGWEGYEGMDGGMGGEIVRDMETEGVSRFWETVPKAGRFFCAIVGL